MFFNILRISVSNDPKSFLNITVIHGCIFVVFHLQKNNLEEKIRFIAQPLPWPAKCNIIANKNDF